VIKKQTLRKSLLYLNIGFLIILVAIGINDYLSGKSLDADYWAMLIMFFAILPGTLHMQNKE
tara:strand:+ start:483 stop:668 length:186 start_codon:yes stop_codon:yes gene_type:complete